MATAGDLWEPQQSLALGHTYCQILLCHINSQLFSERPSVRVWSCNGEETSATACLVRVSEGGGGVSTPLAWRMAPCRMRYCLPHLPTLKEKEFQDVPGRSAVLREVCIPLCSPAWHLAWLSHPPLEHLTTPSGLQMEINRALEKCALKWPLLSD